MIKLFSVKEKQRAAAADGQDAGADRQSNAGKLTAGELRIQKVCNAHESGRNGMENDDDVCMEESQSLWDFSDSMIRLEVFWNEQQRMVIDIRLSEFSHMTCGCWHTYVIARYPSLRVCRLDCSFTGHLRAESRENDEHAVRDARDRSIYITHLQDDVRAYMRFGACRSHVLILRICHTMPSARDDTIQNARACVCVCVCVHRSIITTIQIPRGKGQAAQLRGYTQAGRRLLQRYGRFLCAPIFFSTSSCDAMLP